MSAPVIRSQAITADAERTVNWYPEVLESAGAKTQAALYPTPGVQAYTTLTDFPVRGMFQQDTYIAGVPNSLVWVVSGSTLYVVNSSAGNAIIGLVTASSLPATFASSGATGTELMVLSGGTATIVDLTAGGIGSTSALAAQTCGYLSNRFLALDASTGTLKMSNILDGIDVGRWQLHPAQRGGRPVAGDGGL